MKKMLITLLGTSSLLSFSTGALSADYVIDTAGAHASINFKIKHAGFSWLTGRFNTFDGKFSYDKDNISGSNIQVNIDTASIDSNHAKRDKHLRSDDFLNVEKFPTSTFISKNFIDKGNGKIDIIGDLTLNGVTKSIKITAKKIAEGERKNKYLAGFNGQSEIVLKDFNIKKDLGPASASVFMDLHIEGIRQ
ncbi:MAG: YceI family protein [Cellvibrionaceae bacterium]